MNHTGGPKGNRQMRRVLNQAANAAVKGKRTVFAVVYRLSSRASDTHKPSARSLIGSVA